MILLESDLTWQRLTQICHVFHSLTQICHVFHSLTQICHVFHSFCKSFVTSLCCVYLTYIRL